MDFASDSFLRDGFIGGDGGAPFHVYIDKDTLEKNGNTLIYWQKIINDPPSDPDVRNEILKFEVNLSSNPITCRRLERHCYDPNGNETCSYLIPRDAGTYCSGAELNTALSFVKGNQSRPTP
jgi:hypothetical protein